MRSTLTRILQPPDNGFGLVFPFTRPLRNTKRRAPLGSIRNNSKKKTDYLECAKTDGILESNTIFWTRRTYNNRKWPALKIHKRRVPRKRIFSANRRVSRRVGPFVRFDVLNLKITTGNRIRRNLIFHSSSDKRTTHVTETNRLYLSLYSPGGKQSFACERIRKTTRIKSNLDWNVRKKIWIKFKPITPEIMSSYTNSSFRSSGKRSPFGRVSNVVEVRERREHTMSSSLTKWLNSDDRTFIFLYTSAHPLVHGVNVTRVCRRSRLYCRLFYDSRLAGKTKS